MSSEHPVHPHGELDNLDVAHETSDIDLKAIVWFVVILTAIVLAVDVVTWGMFKAMNRYEAANEPYVTPLAVPVGQEPPEPRLQTTPWTDLKQLRTQEHTYLTSYGWVDEKLGVILGAAEVRALDAVLASARPAFERWWSARQGGWGEYATALEALVRSGAVLTAAESAIGALE